MMTAREFYHIYVYNELTQLDQDTFLFQLDQWLGGGGSFPYAEFPDRELEDFDEGGFYEWLHQREEEEDV